jgi:hypothetical protein
MSDFIALHAINAPNSYARAYNPGDGIDAPVVEAWGLIVGDDVEPADGYRHPRPAEDSNDRASWEAYVVGKGTTLDDARAASLDGLRGMYEPDPAPEPPAHDLPANASPEGVDGTGVQNPTPVDDTNIPGPDEPAAEPADVSTPDRPAESARKTDWVEYVIAAGGDETWAHADDTTKADLIAWKPDGE